VVTVRDEESRALLAEIGVAVDRVEVTADPCFGLTPAPEPARDIIADLDQKQRPLVAVALRPWQDATAGLVNAAATALDAFLDRHGGHVLLLPFHRKDDQPDDDLPVAEALRRAMAHAHSTTVVTQRTAPAATAAVLAACDLVVAMRYHSALLSALAGVPLVTLEYDDKVRSLTRQLGCEQTALSVSGLAAGDLEDALERAWNERRDQARRLAGAARELRRRAARNPQLLQELLQGAQPVRPTLSSESLAVLGALAVELALIREDAHRARDAAIWDRDQARVQLQSLTARHDAVARELDLVREQQHALAQRAEPGPGSADAAALEQVRAAVSELETGLTRLRASRTAQIAKLLLALRWLPWRSRLGLLPRLVLRLFRPDLDLGLPEGEPLQTMGQAIATLSETTARLTAAQPAGRQLPAIARAHPLVTVLLPVYNHADLLVPAVASVRAQTYPHWQLIILDDGSTDDIDSVFAALADDPRIRLYRQPNQKLANALSHLHRLAESELVTWTSADNMLAPEMLSVLVEAITQDPGTVLVWGDGSLIDEHGQPYPDADYRNHNRDPEHPDLMRLPRHPGALGEEVDNFINACFLYRRRAAVAVGDYASDLDCFEDYDFFLRLRRAGRCRHVANHEPLYRYRVHRRTMSRQVLDDGWEAHLPRAQKLIELDRRRQAWVDRRWQVSLSSALEPARQERLRTLLLRLPVDLVADRPGGSDRHLAFLEDGEEPVGEGVCVLCEREHYRLYINRQARAEVPVGEQLSLLATKARYQHNPQRYQELTAAGDQPCIGTHMSLAAVDVGATIALVQAHPELFFVLFDHEEQPDPARGEAIRAACERSCIYLGPRPYGMAYFAYAELAAVICPPLQAGAQRPLQQSLQLALATGRWLLYPASSSLPETPPLAVPYDIGQPLPPVWQHPQPDLPDQLLDRWLARGSEAARLEQVLRLADVAGQNLVERPDLGPTVPAVHPPEPWRAG
jgi:glycosyltransferase involved in cell wall biosynthesis